jgi:hypothetical protein
MMFIYADDVNVMGDFIRTDRNEDVNKCLQGYWFSSKQTENQIR